MVMDFDPNSRDECLGIANINLQVLRDQCKHEEWFELFNNNGMKSNAKILLSMQWIYSYVLLKLNEKISRLLILFRFHFILMLLRNLMKI